MKKLILISTAVLFLAAAHSMTNAQGMWTQKANFGGVARSAAVGFSIGNRGYIGIGLDGTRKQDFWEWDQTTDVWTQKADFGGIGRWQAIGFSIGTKGYIGTGDTCAFCHTNDFWEWDQSTNIWTQKADFGGSARYQAVGFSIGTKGYIGTGWDGIRKQDFWEWDPATNIWTQKANVGGTARSGAVGFSIGTKGYIGTGYEGSGIHKKDFWEWDPATNIWTQKADFGGSARTFAVGFSIGTKGFIGTGDTTTTLSGPKKEFWEWDQATNVWSQKTDFGGGTRSQVVGFSIGTKGYIGTGKINQTTHFQDFWEYYDSTNVVAVNENTLENSISIFPNPFSSQTTLQTDNHFKNASLTVYNSFGQTVKQFVIRNSSSFVIRRDDLPSGLYFVRLTEDNKTIAVDKLVITDK